MSKNEETTTELIDRIAKLESANKTHQNTFEKLVESDLMTTARIAAIEKFVKELALESLGDTMETNAFCTDIDKYFHQKLAEIKKFKGGAPSSPASN